MKVSMDRAIKIQGNRVYLIFLYLSSTLWHNGDSLDLTIDNRLLVVPSDCYTRVSIGSRIVDSLVISTIQANTVGDCEAACSTNGTSCGSFSFGVGNRGNGSCLLGNRSPEGPMDIQRDSNYDVYAKGKISLRGCQTSSRLALSTTPMTSTSSMPLMTQNGRGMPPKRAGPLHINTARPQRLFGNTSLLNAFGNSAFNRNNNRSGISRNMRPFSPLDSINDDRLRTSDILHNKKDYRGLHDDVESTEKSHFDEWSNLKSTDDKLTLGKWQKVPYGFNDFPIISDNNFKSPDYRYHNHEDHNGNPDLLIVEEDEKFENAFGRRLNSPKVFGEFQGSTVLKKARPDEDDDYVTEFDEIFDFGQKLNEKQNLGIGDDDFWINLSPSIKRPSIQQNDASEPTNEVKACFRRLLSGKRIADPYIKRVMECERLHDCHRMCEYERGFTCEGFNYRPRPGAKGMCELVSMPPNRVDVNRDFVPDPRYDYYERDWTRRKCEPRRNKVQPSPPVYHSGASVGWWGGDSGGQRGGWTSSRRPGGHYIPPEAPVAPPITPAPPAAPYGGTFVENTRLSFDVPRTIDHDRRRPDPWFRPGLNDVARPTHPNPLSVKPLEDTWPSYPQTRAERPRPDDFHPVDGNRKPVMGYPTRYLPSRPSNDGYSGNGYSYGRPGDSWMNDGGRYPIRRGGYTPDPATNEISPQYIHDDRKPPKPHSSEGYGPSYADGYSTHHSPPKPPIRPLQPESPPARAPPEHDSSYGSFYNYGGAYGYSDRHTSPKISPTPPPRDCSIRSAGGFRLARGIIRKSYLTANLGQCESLCQSQKEFTCLTFAYRYTLAATSPSDNCLLSDAPFDNLVFYTDLEPDRDYDIYAMLASAKWCETRGRPSSSPRRPRPPDECFWRVRSGSGMPPSVVKKPKRVEGMGECQVECVHAKDFTCRSFVFRYDSHSIPGLPNCYLSDWPAVEIDPHKMQDMDGAELYERGSFGRGCEPHHPIPLPDPPTSHRPALGHKPSRSDEASCYAGYDRPCKLTPYAIILTAKMDSEADCRRKCTVMRQNVGRDSPPCMSFSYKITDDDGEDNCHISDVSTRDLRPGLDYTHDEDYSLYVFKELEPKCSPLPDSPIIPSTPSSHPQKPYTNPEDPYYYEVNIPHPTNPSEPPLGYTYPHPHEKLPQDERFFYPPELTIFNHYTVNGYPCKRGTKCERHPVAGFWSCQPEGSEPDSWDYCCEPSHQCGFSQGFSYPWCYVGASTDQWRPCSERYYPYSSKPTIPKPSKPISHRPHFTKCEYQVHCEGRHWPVAVLHGEAPPNGTDSVALANNNNHREFNHSEAVGPSAKAIDEGRNDTNSSEGSLKKRRSEQVISPLRVINGDGFVRINQSEFQRANSRFRPIEPTNSSLINVSRVSRNDDSPQFFITKRLNAGFSTLSERPRGKGAVAKIERIERPRDGRGEVSERFVMVTSSKRSQSDNPSDFKIHNPAVALGVTNKTNIDSNSTRHWVKMKTIDSEKR